MSLSSVQDAGPPPVEEVDSPPSPPHRRPWGFWMTLEWTLLAGVVGIAGGVAIIVFFKLEFEDSGVDAFTVASESVTYLSSTLALLVLASAARLARWPVREYFALLVPKSRDLWLAFACLGVWLAIGMALLYFFDLGAADSKYMIEAYRATRLAGTVPLLWVTAVIVAPLAEEAIFRGFVYRGWSQSWLGSGGTIVVTAVAFGLLHQQYTWVGIVDCTVFGLIAGWARWRSGSLLTPVLLHVVNNIGATAYAAMQAG